MSRLGKRALRRLALTSALALASALVEAQPLYSHLRMVVPSGPGGGWDITARVIQSILQAEGIAGSSSVENISGGNGLVGLTRFVGAERGNAAASIVVGGATVGAAIVNGSSVTLADLTPVAGLVGEASIFAVPSSSPFLTLPDLLRTWREHPEAVSFGGGGPAGTDHMAALLLADAVGIEPRRVNFVGFGGGGGVMTAVLGGQVSVGVNVLTAIRPHAESGAMRVLGVASAERIPGFDAPTLREQGFDVRIENWRALMGPPGLSPADRTRLESLATRVVASAQWRAAMTKYQWTDRFLTGEALTRFIDAEDARYRELAGKTGMTSTEASGVSELYPTLVLSALGVALVAFAAARRRAGPSSSERPGIGWQAVGLVGVALVVNVVAMEPLGFVLASTGLFWMTARAFDDGRPVRDGVLAVAFGVGAYMVFAYALTLPLAEGVLAGWL
jgi:putative tricarboxylic transport membrane protein